MENNLKDYDFIYKTNTDNVKPIEPTFGVKFSNDIFINEACLKKWNILYVEEELEDTPLGKCVRIKK